MCPDCLWPRLKEGTRQLNDAECDGSQAIRSEGALNSQCLVVRALGANAALETPRSCCQVPSSLIKSAWSPVESYRVRPSRSNKGQASQRGSREPVPAAQGRHLDRGSADRLENTHNQHVDRLGIPILRDAQTSL
jgi:hypothetical protein